MRFIETPLFTRAIVDLVDEESYRSLQLALVQRPEAGALILKSGGLRKLRWSLPGRGKRGGLRSSTSGTGRAKLSICSTPTPRMSKKT
jgi:hypothetical protein